MGKKHPPGKAKGDATKKLAKAEAPRVAVPKVEAEPSCDT